MKIGLIGLTFYSGNKGCEALSYSFLEVLNRIAVKRGILIEACLIEAFPTRLWIHNNFRRKKIMKNYLPSTNLSNIKCSCIFYKRIGKKIIFEQTIKKCDCVFDFTYGDSFTDIYGEDRFISGSRLKEKIINMGTPLILGSQTIGPFNSKKNEKIAADIINSAKEVYVRDQLSFEYTKKISGRLPLLTTDIAFLLQYDKPDVNEKSYKQRIGFNPSGLLWNGGYTRNNQFNLTVNYQQYCKAVIKKMISEGIEVHLILHAYSSDLSRADNDLVAAKALHSEFPETIMSPMFNTPMEAKSYIAKMDLFIGARMHATIGAFSANVPVIPFSYSRKFEGLFNSLKYDYIINGYIDTTEEAITKTTNWISNNKKLSDKMIEGEQVIEEMNEFLINSYDSVIQLSRRQ